MLKKVFRGTQNLLLVKLCYTHEDAFVNAVKIQNKYLNNTYIIPIVGVPQAAMTSMRPKLLQARTNMMSQSWWYNLRFHWVIILILTLMAISIYSRLVMIVATATSTLVSAVSRHQHLSPPFLWTLAALTVWGTSGEGGDPVCSFGWCRSCRCSFGWWHHD